MGPVRSKGPRVSILTNCYRHVPGRTHDILAAFAIVAVVAALPQVRSLRRIPATDPSLRKPAPQLGMQVR